MSITTQPLDLSYAKCMKNHPYGTALYTPLPFRHFHPGSCGYFDVHGSWNPIADLSGPRTLSSQGYSPVPEELHRAPPEAAVHWGPKISETTRARRLGAEAGISAAWATVLPVDLGAWYSFSSVKEGGAVLLTKAPVRHDRFYYESPFKAWVRQNAAGLVVKRKELLQCGLWVVTSTWTTDECAINVWNGVGKGVNVGFKTGVVELGELAPSGEWWEDGSDAGWIRAKALEVGSMPAAEFGRGFFFFKFILGLIDSRATMAELSFLAAYGSSTVAYHLSR